jgi:hypothetical protein
MNGILLGPELDRRQDELMRAYRRGELPPMWPDEFDWWKQRLATYRGWLPVARMPLAQLQERPLVTERTVATLVSPTENAQTRQRLPLGTTYQALRLRLSGSYVVTVAGTLREDSPLNYLRSVDLVLGGSNPLRVHDARMVATLLNAIQGGGAQPRLTAPSAGVGTTSFAAEFFVDLWQPDLLYGLPRTFWLDTRYVSSSELVLTIGGPSEISSATATTSGVKLVVDLIEVLNRGGLLSRMQILRQVVQAVSATGVLDLQPFAGGGVQYRGFLVHATSGNADPNLATSDDTIITDTTVFESGGLRLVDAVTYETLRNELRRNYNMRSADLHAGWEMIDFAKEHHLDDRLDSRGAQNLTMRFTIGAAPANTFLQVYPLVYQQRRQAQAGRQGVVVRAA